MTYFFKARNKFSFIFVLGCLAFISNIHAQEEFSPETFFKEEHLILDLDVFLELDHANHYFVNENTKMESRSQGGTWSVPQNYSDILHNAYFEDLGYEVSLMDTMILNPLFMPLVFTGKVLPPKMPLLAAKEQGNIFLGTLEKTMFASPLLSTTSIFEKELYDEELQRQAYLALTANPSRIRFLASDMPKDIERAQKIEVNTFKDLFKVENNPNFQSLSSPDRFDPGRKFWFFNGSSQLQFSQNYISENWYQGGTGNLNIFSTQKLVANYKKEKLQFNNMMEWKLSFYTNPNDSLRPVKIGTDLLRTYSDIGFRAFNDKWSYSSNLEMKVQMFNNHQENTNKKIASFLSPLLVNMGVLGMKYSLNKQYKNKHKKLSINADISPLSVKFSYIHDQEVDPTRYGIPADRRSLLELGSTINSSMMVNFSRFVSLRMRFKYFTRFDRVEMELENELNMAINRYFSTRIYLYSRLDDNSNRPYDAKFGYFQINELLSFGFNFRW